jgi:hypothetical protein
MRKVRGWGKTKNRGWGREWGWRKVKNQKPRIPAGMGNSPSPLQPYCSCAMIRMKIADSFLRGRQSHDHEATAMMKAQFMSLWDGFSTSESDVIVMGATNRPEDVDKAILRRMPARFAVPVPVSRSLVFFQSLHFICHNGQFNARFHRIRFSS